MQLNEGIYESIINNALENKLNQMDKKQYFISKIPVDKAEASKLISDYVSRLMVYVLNEFKGENSLKKQIEFCNKVLNFIDSELKIGIKQDLLSIEGELLTGIISKIGLTDEIVQNKVKNNYPSSGLSFSSLFTGALSDVPIDLEIEKDILTSDRIYWIVSFIRWSGLRLFENALKEITSKSNKQIKIITTTYMAASEARALEFLSNLENTEIKVSYQTNLERLHAKSYIFERDTGYDTAYIGSSNLSHSALTKGLEWNIRVTGRENKHIIDKAKATFDHYWNSIDFEDFKIGGLEKFRKALNLERNKRSSIKISEFTKFTPTSFQKEILDKLKIERELYGRYRNLIVAATGTGKTVVSAFDFKRYFSKNKQAKLLFIAHRREILIQACRTFRSVIGEREFGQLWVGNTNPDSGNLNHLFISVQTFNSKKEVFATRFKKDFYDFIIIDEAHHSKANSYRLLFELFDPEILLGLTATPERMDGQSLLPDFCDKIAAEIRLPDALNLKLLSPFHYFCITDDSADLRVVKWTAGRYDATELSKVLTTKNRSQLIVNAILHYLTDPYNCKALCFCSTKEHAEFMNNEFIKVGFKSTFLVSGNNKNNDEERKAIHQNLKAGKVNFVCVVDIFNEGIDLPEIDTVLFLRPTESLTIFLQQLGRGLRISEDKDCLTVLDFVSQSNVKYNEGQRFRALVGKSDTNITHEIKNGFPGLPAGCSIKLEKQAKEYILSNIKSSIFNLRKLTHEISNFTHNTNLPLTLSNFLKIYELDIRSIYKNQQTWNKLKSNANLIKLPENKYYEQLNKGLRRLIQIDSPKYLRYIQNLIKNDFQLSSLDRENDRFALMFYYDLWQKGIGEFGFSSIFEGIRQVRNHQVIKDEINEIINYLSDNLNHSTKTIQFEFLNILEMHARYSRDQILAAFEKSTPETPFPSQEGVVVLNEINTEILLVTLNKSDKDFSATTQYEDYAISETIFHWQSQNKVRPDSPTGRSYINHKKNQKNLLLFVRENKKDIYGLTMPYHFLGPVEYMSYKGSRPMSINWRLEEPMPAYLWKSAGKMAVG